MLIYIHGVASLGESRTRRALYNCSAIKTVPYIDGDADVIRQLLLNDNLILVRLFTAAL